MKLPAFSVVLIALLIASGARQSLAQYTNGQSADVVLGQPNFTTATPGTNASQMNGPFDSAIDPATGKLFVADAVNNRVLRFGSAAAAASGAGAEAVFGQPDFATVTAGTTQSKMAFPSGVFVDSGGRLWVAEFNNNRVLRFDNASNASSGANADAVLGQPDFVTSAGGATAAKMSGPIGVFVDAAGRLWTGEQTNQRVLRFDNAASKTNGANADGVLGKPNFAPPVGAPSASVTGAVGKVVGDAAGTLWVADFGATRVLRFDNAAAKANGAAADGVLGHTDFTTTTGSATQSTFINPTCITLDPAGRLYVSNGTSGNRLLIFKNAKSKANGANADFVLGQANFASTGAATTSTGFTTPRGPVFNPSGFLYVADFGNNRTVRFTPNSGFPLIKTVPNRRLIPAGTEKNVRFEISTAGFSDSFRLQAPSGSRKKARVKYLFNGVDVTAAVVAGTLDTTELEVGEKAILFVKIKARKNASGKFNRTLTATSNTRNSVFATKTAKITITP